MALNAIFNPIFGPLLKLGMFWAILIISVLMAIIITFVYKWMTDQTLMKTLKGDMKQFQKEMKELKHDPKRVMAIQKKSMETNMKYMMHSMKPTLVTFLPLILIFGWMNSHLAYEPILPDTEFTTSTIFDERTKGEITLVVPEQITLISDPTQEITNSMASWDLEAEAGEYILEYEYDDQTFKKEVLITNKQEYKSPVKKIKDSNLKAIQINNKVIKPLGNISIFGWRPGWLGTYIILSIIFSIGLRKLLKLH